MRLGPEFALTAIVTAGVGVGMVRMGLRKRLLEARADSRRCPSCGQAAPVQALPTLLPFVSARAGSEAWPGSQSR